MSTNKNTLNYFPRGTKKKSEEEGSFIFNTIEKKNKRGRDGAKFIISNKKKRAKARETEDFINDSEFIIGKSQAQDLEEGISVTNKVPMYNPGKGSLVMMAISKVHKDQFIILNHSRNK